MIEEQKIKPTGDRKTRFYASQKNTFGLLPGLEGTCPCATTSEGGCWHVKEGRKLPECYVAGTMNSYPGVKGILEHNTKLMFESSVQVMTGILNYEFYRFAEAENKRERDGKQPYRFYRLHWAGDIFSTAYAAALSAAIGCFPSINFWGYTRSFFTVPQLVHLPNLTLYLSLDPVNVQRGLSVFNEYKQETNNLQICYMNKMNDFQDHLARAKQILDEENKLRISMKQTPKENWADKQSLRACPVDTGKLPLEEGCAHCKQCFREKAKPIWFET